MKRRYIISDNKGKLGSKVLYADYLEYQEGNALFWKLGSAEKELIGLFSLKHWNVIEERE